MPNADTLKWIFSNIPFIGPSSCAAVWTERNTMYENMKTLDKRALSKIHFLCFKRNKSIIEVDLTLKLRKSTSLFINKFFKSNNLKKILHNTTFLVQLPNIAVSPFKKIFFWYLKIGEWTYLCRIFLQLRLNGHCD